MYASLAACAMARLSRCSTVRIADMLAAVVVLRSSATLSGSHDSVLPSAATSVVVDLRKALSTALTAARSMMREWRASSFTAFLAAVCAAMATSDGESMASFSDVGICDA